MYKIYAVKSRSTDHIHIGQGKIREGKVFFLELTVRYHESVLCGISFANKKAKSRKSITKIYLGI
jgi:hypothetical protein